jgi:hypothetical protein
LFAARCRNARFSAAADGIWGARHQDIDCFEYVILWKGILSEGGSVYRDFELKVVAATKGYPLKWRAAKAMIVFAVLSVTTIKQWSFEPSSWHFEPVKAIVICACSVACLFQPRGRWFMFFLGVAFGDILLAALK